MSTYDKTKIEKMCAAHMAKNATGFPGVTRVKNLFVGRVTINGKRLQSLGYETPEQAAKWREAQIAHHRDKRVSA